VRLRAVAAIGLECTLGHRDPLLFPKENLRFSNFIEYIAREIFIPLVARFTMWQVIRSQRSILRLRCVNQVKREEVHFHFRARDHQMRGVSPPLVQLIAIEEKLCE
jgi:hypothetical protein